MLGRGRDPNSELFVTLSFVETIRYEESFREMRCEVSIDL